MTTLGGPGWRGMARNISMMSWRHIRKEILMGSGRRQGGR